VKNLWKALGVAGAVGLTATGVLAVRHERQRRAYTPEQVRERLHERLAELDAASDDIPGAPSGGA
jgi:hypothetical protein